MLRRIPQQQQSAASVARLSAWLALALLMPRLIRILYPYVWVEDDLLLESAFAVSKGLRPYVDFAHAQMPLLEWVAGLYISLVGASHVAMETLNGLAIYVSSVFVWMVALPAVGRRAATAAAMLFACHSQRYRRLACCCSWRSDNGGRGAQRHAGCCWPAASCASVRSPTGATRTA
jgi:hypothetical protein